MIQRVSQASVGVGGTTVGAIETGFLVLVGVESADGAEDMITAASKLVGMRVFPDSDGRMNVSIKDVGGKCLVVSQFTLLGDVRRGRRPSFTRAADPQRAAGLIREFEMALRQEGVVVESGEFGSNMDVALVNDGPVTILVEVRGGKIV